jgi:predicted enzyme related to lactoylglutathione lyase
MSAPFLGLYTALYHVTDLDRAKAWYAGALGLAPYFDQPFYVGFNVGGCELGLVPTESGTRIEPGGVIAYWGVASIKDAWTHLLGAGATAVSEPQDVGEGIQVATVADPFGNPLGVIENPHFGR